MLSNLFGGTVNREHGSLRRQNAQTPVLNHVPQITPPVSRPSSNDGPSKTNSPAQIVHAAADALHKLEETLNSYIQLLDARRGNFLGKILRGRSAADEVLVNEIYNALIENPDDIQGASASPIDVLFCAFEKFVKMAWDKKIGAIISQPMWGAIQSNLDLYPGDFEEFFRAKFGEMAPQNQRALRKCVKLLADLLGSQSNDGDRGALTASFAEVLAPEGNANDFVMVLDRLVEDIDTLLGEPALSVQATPQGSISESIRTRATNTGSLTSNTSLRKKFGLSTLTRKSSKLLSDDSSERSDIGSLWRGLSKSKHGADQSSSISKASNNLGRSNSTDFNARVSPKRPVSRDRPNVLGAFPFEQHKALSTIGEDKVPGGPPRKKRRSSISDLRSLQAEVHDMPLPSLVPAPLAVPSTPSTPKREASPNRTLSTPSGIPTLSSIPTREGSPIRTVPKSEVTITSHQHQSTPTRRRKESGIPTLRSPPTANARSRSCHICSKNLNCYHYHAPRCVSLTTLIESITTEGLFERPTAGNVLRKLPTASPEKPLLQPSLKPSAKLRMQSPQKLRERLQAEKKYIQDADSTLQAELSKISDEIRSSSSKSTPLEAKLTLVIADQANHISTLNSRIENLTSDVNTSLQVSENRTKNLNVELNKLEVELAMVYESVNERLISYESEIRRGDGVAAMKEQRKIEAEESARLRKENARLRREVAGLRAQMRD